MQARLCFWRDAGPCVLSATWTRNWLALACLTLLWCHLIVCLPDNLGLCSCMPDHRSCAALHSLLHAASPARTAHHVCFDEVPRSVQQLEDGAERLVGGPHAHQLPHALHVQYVQISMLRACASMPRRLPSRRRACSFLSSFFSSYATPASVRCQLTCSDAPWRDVQVSVGKRAPETTCLAR